MRNERPPSIDGFIPRRSMPVNGSADGSHGLQPSQEGREGFSRPGSASEGEAGHNALKPEQHHALTRADMDASLTGIAEEDKHDKQKRKKHLNKKKLIKRILIVVLVLGLLIAGFLGVKFLIASGNIFKGDLLGLVQAAPLKTDANGRSNILVFGTSEDSRAHNEQGAGVLLTDSMLIVSVDQEKKDAYMVSIPRDMYVEYGAACNAGYSGRINEVYQCFSNNGEDEEAGTEALRKKAGEVVGLDVQYTTQVNYSVVEDAVDAVGGISVEIDSDDPRGIYDPNFDWQCNNQCNLVRYDNGPTGTIDGERALALARARNASGGYGLSGGNFDREQYQQKIIKALREKAASAGTLTNIGKVTSLIDALGDNLRTNFETKEIRTLMDLGNSIPNEEIVSIDLSEADPAVYTGVNVGGGALLTPTSGDFNYSSISSYVQQQISSDPVVREQAKIGIYNGSGTAGAAGDLAEKLRLEGFTIVDNAIGNAPDGEYASYEIYDMTEEKTATREKLEALYGVEAKTTPPPVNVIGMDIIIIIGPGAAQAG